MGAVMEYDFEWDPNKARLNRQKHAVTFEQATAVFRDPRAISIYDKEHSATEDRGMTLGLSLTGVVLVVHHTFEELNEQMVRIRIFSSREATRREKLQYAG